MVRSYFKATYRLSTSNLCKNEFAFFEASASLSDWLILLFTIYYLYCS